MSCNASLRGLATNLVAAWGSDEMIADEGLTARQRAIDYPRLILAGAPSQITMEFDGPTPAATA